MAETMATGLKEAVSRAVARTLIWGCVYLYTHVLPDEFLFKSNSN